MMTAEDLNEFNRSFDPLRNKYLNLYELTFNELEKLSINIKGERIAYIGDRLGTPNMKLYNEKIEICSGNKVSKTVYIECFGISDDSVATIEQACICMEDYLDKRNKNPEYKAEISYDDMDNEATNEDD